MKEIWKDITGYEGLYQVSNLGRVKSLDRLVNGRNMKIVKPVRGRVLKLSSYNNLYPSCSLGNNANTKMVHRLVASAFIPNPENKPYVNHKNGIKTDNRVTNLEWVTAKENNDHAIKNGLWNCSGESNYLAKLTDKSVLKIRKLVMSGLKHSAISEQFGVSKSTISHIITGRKWKHVL